MIERIIRVLVTKPGLDGRFLLYGGGTSEILRNIIAREMGAPKRRS
ncbi:MAG: hypothetical protein ACE5E7_03865 [Anaerolineae bacterium]